MNPYYYRLSEELVDLIHDDSQGISSMLLASMATKFYLPNCIVTGLVTIIYQIVTSIVKSPCAGFDQGGHHKLIVAEKVCGFNSYANLNQTITTW